MKRDTGMKRRAWPADEFRNYLQKLWISSERDSSLEKLTGVCPNSILFFDCFLKTPVNLDSEWTIEVRPKHWALAFLQWNLRDIAIILSEVVFSESEMRARDRVAGSSFSKLECLDLRKKNAIRNAVYWMKDKTKDPWSYRPQEVKIPDDDLAEIDNGFLDFHKVIKVEEESILSELTKDIDRKEASDYGKFQRLVSWKLQDLLQEILQMKINPTSSGSHEHIFKTVTALIRLDQKVALNLLGLEHSRNFAMAVKDLTRKAILNDDFSDIFLDAVQLSQDELTVLERRRSKGMAEMVRSLFRMIYCRYNNKVDPQDQNATFRSLEEDAQASVLLLSIIRGVKWLEANSSFGEKLMNVAGRFESLDKPHNVFPTREETDEIFKVLGEAWGPSRLGSLRRNSLTNEICHRFRETLSLGSPQGTPQSAAESMSTDLILSEGDMDVSVDARSLQIRYECGDSSTLGQVDSLAVLDHPTIRFPFSVLNEALLAMTKSDCRDPGFEVGKRLFTYLFSQDEIDNGSLHALKRSSRRPMTMGFFTHPQLQVKSHALLDMVKVLFALHEGGVTELPHGSIRIPGEVETVRVKDLLGDLRRKIFIEYRMQKSSIKEYSRD